LKETEVLNLIDQFGFQNRLADEEIKEIIKITQNVPLFLNMLREIVNKNKDKNLSNILIIEELRKVIKKFITERAHTFFINRFKEIKDAVKTEIFKEILFNLNSKEKEFKFRDIKDILDYQLMDFKNIDEDKTILDLNHDDINRDKSERVTENLLIKQFYAYIEDKEYKMSPSESYYIEIADNMKVRVVSR